MVQPQCLLEALYDVLAHLIRIPDSTAIVCSAFSQGILVHTPEHLKCESICAAEMANVLCTMDQSAAVPIRRKFSVLGNGPARCPHKQIVWG